MTLIPPAFPASTPGDRCADLYCRALRSPLTLLMIPFLCFPSAQLPGLRFGVAIPRRAEGVLQGVVPGEL